MSMMSHDPINNIPFYLLTIAMLIMLATYIWNFQSVPGAKPQVGILVCKIVWLLCLVLITVSPSVPEKLLWKRLQQIAGILSPLFWYTFVVEISRQEAKVTIWLKYSLTGITICLILGILSDPLHSLFLQQAWLDGQTLKLVIGSGIWALRIGGYLLSGVALVLSIRWIWITAGLRQRQALWFTLAGVISVIGSLLDFIPVLHKFSPLPLCFVIGGIIIAWGFRRWQFYNIIPLAKEVATKNMVDGLLVVDEYGYIVEVNPAAQLILAKLPSYIGGRFEDLAAAWPILKEAYSLQAKNVEAARNLSEGTFYYQLKATALAHKDHQLGKVIILKDITKEKQEQAQLLDEQKALSVLAERNRLSRELHDMHGQFPGYVKTQTQVISLLLAKGRLTEAAEQLQELKLAADAAFTDVRASIATLKAADKEDFFKNLRQNLQQFQKISGIIVVYAGPDSTPSCWVSAEAEVQLLRIVQETLANVRKHSSASQVEVDFCFTNELVLTIKDNGEGFDVENRAKQCGNFGLQILEERAVEVGGTCKIKSVPGQGTVVLVKLPLLQPRK